MYGLYILLMNGVDPDQTERICRFIYVQAGHTLSYGRFLFELSSGAGFYNNLHRSLSRFSRQHIMIFFLFSWKGGENLHDMSKTIFWKTLGNISKGQLLIVLLSRLLRPSNSFP